MTDDTPVGVPGPDLEGGDEYDRMIAAIDAALDEALYKIAGDGRLRDVDTEKVRVKYLRAIGYLVSQRRQLVEDVEKQELIDRIAELEELADRREVARA